MKLYTLLLLLILISCQFQKTPNFDLYIDKWKADLIKNGDFLSTNKCNYNKENLANYDGIPIGIPEDLNKSYADINNDGIIDALITFKPVQCDGGNATKYFQYALLILSNKDKYIVIQETPSLNLGFAGDFFEFLSAQKGSVKATYLKIREEDGLCCIQKDTTLIIKKNKLIY